MKNEQPNLNYIKQLSDNDVAFKNRIIRIIKQEFQEEKKTFLNNYNKKKYLNASENVHKITHKISILGLEKNYELAQGFEKDLKNKDTTKFKDFLKLLQVIEDFLVTL